MLCSQLIADVIQVLTETALCSVLDEIVDSINNGDTVALMSLDISAAFDAVPHDILIQRLEEEFGVTGRCCQWIASYLTGRSFSVRVDVSGIDFIVIADDNWCPTELILGPLLYTAYFLSLIHI